MNVFFKIYFFKGYLEFIGFLYLWVNDFLVLRNGEVFSGSEYRFYKFFFLLKVLLEKNCDIVIRWNIIV